VSRTVRIALVILVLLVPLSGQQAPSAEQQQIEAFRAWLRTLEPQLTPDGITSARYIHTRLGTLLKQFKPVDQPPVDCVLSDFALTTTSPWSACVGGVQTRDEVWTRTVLTPPANGGAACGPLSETRQATQSCQIQPPPGGHAYFDMHCASSAKLACYSLRDSKQLDHPNNGGFAHSNARALVVTYDPVVDAARVTIDTSSNSLSNQVRLPIPAYGSSLFVTWDAWYGDEWRSGISGLETHKEFQFASPATRIWTEVRSRFSQAPKDQIARVDVRYYGTAFGPGSGWDYYLNPAHWSGSKDAIGPQTGEFVIAPKTWTRYYAHFEQDPSGYVAFSLWMADVNRLPVNLLDRRLIKPNSSGRWESFWLEFNTSTNNVKPGRPPLVAYVRNVVMLRGVTSSDVPALLERP
jgi:hypothetical protein